ncbi:MAG TPA: M56 family metallopeptidase [Terriglobales bacterium]|nr:M56 family metallopeptidase [Terriglobales bacterium]
MTLPVITTAITKLLAPSAMFALGWALLHFLWQGAALAALAAALMSLSRRAPVRYFVGVGALALMLAAPAATAFFYAQSYGGEAPMVKQAAALFAEARLGKLEAFAAAVPVAGRNIAAPSAAQGSRWRPTALPWVVEAWLAGVILFSLRSAGGFLLLERRRRRRSRVVGARVLEICRGLEHRLGLDRAIAYCECQWLQAPAVMGWFRPVVFLPLTILSGFSEEQLQSIIAHELAHVRRLDAFVNAFQVSVETLLFYHPAVWWLNQRIRAEREHCCDEIAVAVCGNAVAYARALTRLEELRRAPGFAMAANGGPLTERIVRVLGLKTFGDGMRALGLTASLLCLVAALSAGNVLLAVAHASTRAALLAQAEAASGSQAAAPAAKATPAAKPSPAQAQSREQPSAASSYIDGLRAAGLGDLTADQLIALKIQEVTPEYVRQVQAEGLHPDADQLIAMRVQDISPEYIRELRAEGLNPDLDQLIALKIQGVDASYDRGIKDAGLKPDVDNLIAMKIQGVTPDYVRALKAAGLAVSIDQVIAFKIQDISPEYLKGFEQLGLTPDANDAIAMRIQGVTADYVREIRALGLNPTVDELIAMRVQDVTPAYVKALQAAGFKVDIRDIISAKVQDVTPQFIEQAIRHGFKDLTIEKLIELRRLEILEPKADI